MKKKEFQGNLLGVRDVASNHQDVQIRQAHIAYLSISRDGSKSEPGSSGCIATELLNEIARGKPFASLPM